MTKQSIFFTGLLLMASLLVAPLARTESAQALKEHESDVREEMLQITKELGTTCTECHKVSDFKDAGKKGFGVAAKHMKLVAVMRANGFDGKNGPEANCYMCHRGEMKPPARAPGK